MENNKVGFSPSQLQQMSESQFSTLFYSGNWAQLTNDTKLSMCQELENRLSARDHVEPRSVVPEQMNGACYGYQQGSRIAVNVDMLNDGVFRTTYTDEHGNRVTTEHAVQAASWNVYDTIVHEHTHGVSLDRDQAPYTYITSETDHDLYRIQDEERLAYEAGNKATLEAIDRAEVALSRAEPEKAAYLESINAESYEECLENARLAYNDPDIDKTLAQFISDQDQGIVPENRSESYQQLQEVYWEQTDRQMQEFLGWDKTNTPALEQGVGGSKTQGVANDMASNASQEQDGAVLSVGLAAYGHDGADMTASAEPASYGNDGADMAASAEPASYGNDGADMAVSAEPASYGNDGADMAASADTGGYDGGMDND